MPGRAGCGACSTGSSNLPAETRHYVQSITGRAFEEWAALGREGGKDGIAKPTSCLQLAALLKEQPSFFIGELERHVREGNLRPWGVQLSAGFSRERVLETYARVEREFRTLLEGRDPTIIRTTLRSRGPGGFYQARVGVETRADANKLCRELSAKGAACMVLRNSRGAVVDALADAHVGFAVAIARVRTLRRIFHRAAISARSRDGDRLALRDFGERRVDEILRDLQILEPRRRLVVDAARI